jgi:hypothetical protein
MAGPRVVFRWGGGVFVLLTARANGDSNAKGVALFGDVFTLSFLVSAHAVSTRYKKSSSTSTTRLLHVALVPVVAGLEWCYLCCLPRTSFLSPARCITMRHPGRHASLNWLCERYLPPGAVKTRLDAIWKSEWNGLTATKRGKQLPLYWSCCGRQSHSDYEFGAGACTDCAHRVSGGLEGILQMFNVNTCHGKLLDLHAGRDSATFLYITDLRPKPRVDDCDSQPWDTEDAYSKP